MASYRPLAGCELSLAGGATPLPLESYRPLAGGASCFIMACFDERKTKSVPLRGVRVVSAIVCNISVEWSTVFVQL